MAVTVAAPDAISPHNIEAERSVLGAILLHNEALTVAAQIINARDFFRDAHRVVFEKMVALASRSEAIVPLIRSRGHLPKGGYDVPHAPQQARPAPSPAIL